MTKKIIVSGVDKYLAEPHICQAIREFMAEEKVIEFYCNVFTTPISDVQLYNILDDFRKDNGIYFYQGCKIDYMELKNIILNNYVNIEIIVSWGRTL